MKGSRIRAQCVSAGLLFDRKIPRFLLQQRCNYSLFAAGCTLLQSNWKFTATVSNPGTVGYPFTFELSSLARVTGSTPTYFTDWFAGGWIEFGTGANTQRRPILRSTNPVAGVLTVTISRDPVPFPSIGNTVVLYPGCDGRKESCHAYNGTTNPQGKFDNFSNFGGHPFVPPGNPSLMKISSDIVGAGKK